MKFSVLIWTMGLWLIIQVGIPVKLYAVEIAQRITDREITDKLMRLEVGQEALRSEMKSGQEALRSEMKSGQEALRSEMKSGQEALRSEMKSGQEALSVRISDLRAEMKSSQEALRAEMKTGLEAIGKRMDDLSARQADINATMLVLFTSLIALIVALFGYILWDRRTMMKPVAEKLHRFEHEVISDLDLNHAEGSLLRRQLNVMKKFAAKNSEFAEIMQGEALL
ncbi:hypothetical protein with 16 duplications in BW-1 [Desulfamplus magnetovallimortis]|uniref:Uncharacterized protein n=1 Tax=Desulfamplus magnetovallimortis TaxID=1246637 RepID=L0R4E8_9BACT|nr:hypothetical protein [Desulfamplus magnetovallimortis]CCO06739.1 hypothetical protein with 16 duplications in BW-1 [Desulfamplus magnetovallimortis BW-1]SLM32790.1 hypothetical protein with 16 duplications in BW-1 [Desulfamplus magnetovallimortis]